MELKLQGSHRLSVTKFQDFSRTFPGPNGFSRNLMCYKLKHFCSQKLKTEMTASVQENKSTHNLKHITYLSYVNIIAQRLICLFWQWNAFGQNCMLFHIWRMPPPPKKKILQRCKMVQSRDIFFFYTFIFKFQDFLHQNFRIPGLFQDSRTCGNPVKGWFTML